MSSRYNKKDSQSPNTFKKIVREELEELIESGHHEKADKTTENCFISPTVNTIKKIKSVKSALDSRKLNEACVKRKAAMPKMEELISKISAKITKAKATSGCRRSTKTTPTARRNYLRKQSNFVCFRYLGETLLDITVSRRVSTAYQIFPRCSKNT